jgi:hypothetical protein
MNTRHTAVAFSSRCSQTPSWPAVGRERYQTLPSVGQPPCEVLGGYLKEPPVVA